MKKDLYTQDELIDSAFEFIRINGKEKFSARTFSKSLHISTSPLFKQFKNIAELLKSVKKKAYAFYLEKFYKPSFKKEIPCLEMGVNYILFARKYPNLFKLIFKKEHGGPEFHNFLPAHSDARSEILGVMTKNYRIKEEKARILYNHLAIYTYGLATLFADKLTDFSIEYARSLLSDLFKKLIGETTGKCDRAPESV